MSKHERQPHTQELFAKSIGVDAATLWRWTQKPGWDQAVIKLAMSTLCKHVPEALAALAREAEKGSIQHIKELLSLVGITGDQPEQTVNQHIIVEYISDEDIVAQAADVAERRYQDG